MAYLNAITKTIKQIRDSDEHTRDRYNYHRGLSLHMIKKLMGADHSQWGYINNALKSGVNKGKLIKTACARAANCVKNPYVPGPNNRYPVIRKTEAPIKSGLA